MPDSEPVGIIRRSLAVHRFHNEDPVGKRVSFDDGATWTKIVGMAGDVREFGPHHEAPEQFYYAQPQQPTNGAVLVRAAGDPTAMSNQVRHIIHDVEPDVAIIGVLTLEQARNEQFRRPATITQIFGLYAALALVIAAAKACYWSPSGWPSESQEHRG